MKFVILSMTMGLLISVGAASTEAQGSSLPTTPTQSDQAQGDKKSGNSSENPPQLQEVVVTAQKRKENLQDVPIPVSVVTGAALTDSNQVKLTDYYSEVPGLSIAPAIITSQTLAIRGITTGAVASGPPDPAPTVGIMVDGVPFGGTGGGDTLVPDFDPGDLERVEVLRGPQGTLYGASSLGGLINYVTVSPSTQGVSGRLDADTNSVYNGAELGYTFRGSVNVPLSEDFAVRASAFTRQDPGYIDNPVLQIDGVNEDRASGGHIAALWRPSDSISLKLSALYQHIGSNGSSDVTPVPPPITGVGPLGDLQQYYARGSDYAHATVQAYSAILSDRIGNTELTSLTGYNVYTADTSTDFTDIFGSLTQTYFGVVSTPTLTEAAFNRLTQEVHLSFPVGKRLDGLVGAFYSRTVDKYQFGPFIATDPSTGAIAGTWGTINSTDAPITYTEYAAFTDLTYHATDRLDIQLGGRESEYEIVGEPMTFTGLLSTVFFGYPTENYVAFPEYTVKQNAFTYLFTPQFKLSSGLMVYTRLASGFREGGANAGVPGVPFQFTPDKTQDYEVGLKGYFLERRLFVDTSLYYIDWKNIQLPLLTPSGVSYTGNGGTAKSQGLELSITAKPVNGLTVDGWVSWGEAVLTEAVPGIFGYPGDPLPNTPRFSGSLSLKEEFPISNSIAGFVGGTASYVGNREDIFSAETAQRQYLPPYAKVDLRAGLDIGAWTANVYVNNVSDRRGIISGGIGNVIPYSFYLIQPRTVGLSLSKEFE